MYKCSAAPVSLLFPFFVLRLLQSHQSLFPIFNLIYAQLLFTVRGRSCAEGRRGRCRGCGSRGVRAGRRRRRVEVVGVAALGVRRRRAALTVLLRRQVLAAGRRRRRERLRVVVEVAGVALGGGGGAGLERRPSSRRVVAVAHVSAAGGGGRGEVTVGVGPVAATQKQRTTQHRRFWPGSQLSWVIWLQLDSSHHIQRPPHSQPANVSSWCLNTSSVSLKQ